MRRTLMAAALLALSPAFAQAGPSGWYVIVGSYSPTAMASGAAARRERAAQACGFGVTTQNSGDIVMLRSGLTVQHIGRYPTQAQAQQALTRVQPCVRDAYVKYGIDGLQLDERW